MNDISVCAFRISDDYMKQPERCEHPILLGFTKEERVWTNQERSPEELADFVMADRTRQLILYTAFYNNRIGYTGFECKGSIRKDGDVYYFQADPEGFQGYSEEERKFDLPNQNNAALYDRMIAETSEDPECLHAFVVMIDKDGESGYYLIVRTYPGLGKEEADMRFHREMFLDLLKAADVHSFKQLGKFMNQSQKMFVEFMGYSGNDAQ